MAKIGMKTVIKRIKMIEAEKKKTQNGDWSLMNRREKSKT